MQSNKARAEFEIDEGEIFEFELFDWWQRQEIDKGENVSPTHCELSANPLFYFADLISYLFSLLDFNSFWKKKFFILKNFYNEDIFGASFCAPFIEAAIKMAIQATLLLLNFG